jgi:SPP1 gp7 family putative phage head morphogenesis protein
MQKERHIAVWLRMLAQKEIATARSAGNLLKAQAAAIAKGYKEGGQSGAEEQIKEGVNDWVKLLVATYSVTIKDFAKYTFQQLDSTKKMSFQELVQGFIAREALKKSIFISETTKESVRKVISDGVENGDGEVVIASNINEAVGGTLAANRARTIARTEVHNAATYGMQAAAEETDRPLMREWVSVQDERTRDDHSEADGQQVEMDEPFEVGGESIDRPGEGSPENSINCRCTIIYLGKENEITGGDSGEFLDDE